MSQRGNHRLPMPGSNTIVTFPTSMCRGVLNVVHGTHDVVNAILDHPDIKAVSFVGSDAAGRHVYSRAAASGKRVQVMKGRDLPACVLAGSQLVQLKLRMSILLIPISRTQRTLPLNQFEGSVPGLMPSSLVVHHPASPRLFICCHLPAMLAPPVQHGGQEPCCGHAGC